MKWTRVGERRDMLCVSCLEQMWDKDFLYNDCIAEGMLDLGKHFRRAYKRKTEVLKLFESEQTERAKGAIVKTQQAFKSEQV